MERFFFFFSYLFNLQICEKMSAMGIKRTHCLELSRNHGDLKVSLTEKYHTQDLESKQQNIRTGLESVSQASCVASFFIQAILLIPQRSHSIKKMSTLHLGVCGSTLKSNELKSHSVQSFTPCLVPRSFHSYTPTLKYYQSSTSSLKPALPIILEDK